MLDNADLALHWCSISAISHLRDESRGAVADFTLCARTHVRHLALNC
jgi:hypothetical protein